MINYWPLIGIALVVIGFALKFNPMLVVTISAIVTGLIAGMDWHEVISTFGKAFNDNRIIAIVWIVLPVIGLLERFGLQQRAAAVIRSMRNATTGRLLILYLVYRQITAAACCCRPKRSSRPMTGSTIHTIAMMRLSLNALLNVATTLTGSIPPRMPVTSAEAVTTSIGFILSAKPTTTSRMPSSGR